MAPPNVILLVKYGIMRKHLVGFEAAHPRGVQVEHKDNKTTI
jgi:hypothetical protein